MFCGKLPFVTLSFGDGTKCNNILVWHHCNNIADTTTNVDTSTKCNTAVYDNICGTKCNNYLCYPGNCSKCCIIVVTALLLWSYPGNGAKCDSRYFVYQSSLCSLCLKDPQMENDIIHLKLLPTLGVIRWNKVVWMFASQRQEELSVNN